MLFGDASDFAIEAMSEPHLVPPSAVWGRMCLRINNLSFGDYDEPHCGLGSAYELLKELKDGFTDLWDTGFNALNHTEIYGLLDQALYGDDQRSMADIQRDARRFSRFEFLTNWGEQFDGYKSFILCRDPEELLVLYRTPDDVRGSPSFTANGFVTATQGFLTWFESEGKRLMDKRRKPG